MVIQSNPMNSSRDSFPLRASPIQSVMKLVCDRKSVYHFVLFNLLHIPRKRDRHEEGVGGGVVRLLCTYTYNKVIPRHWLVVALRIAGVELIEAESCAS